MRDPHGRDTDGSGKTRLGHAFFLQDLAKENARMNRGKAALYHVYLQSMVIDDRNVKRVAARESKTHSPLIIDSNAPLTFAVAPQCFKSIRLLCLQISQ
jgi:hypothetical protein